MDTNIKHITVFTGAGISAESGLKTFRGHDGLWEGNRIEDVATPEAWHRNPELVQRFYNERRKFCLQAQPNTAHVALVELARHYDVDIITQNIDDLHERAGSTKVLHLHGEIVKSQSSLNPQLVYPIKGDEIKIGDRCALGSQLRPHVVWFGEAVPHMTKALQIVQDTDVLIVVGTSLQVYPAAQLVFETKRTCRIVVIDPQANRHRIEGHVEYMDKNATEGVPYLVNLLTK